MIKPPGDSKIEAAAAVAKGLVSIIPFIGGLTSEIGNLYFNPLEKRKQKWTEEVSAALNQIREELHLLPEQLQENEGFISVLYQASEMAMRNHQTEKLSALRNALVASAVPGRDYDLKLKMLRFIDELSIAHIRVLGVFLLHANYFSGYTELDQVFFTVRDFLKDPLDRVMFRLIVQDLDARFLIVLGDVEDFEEFKSKKQTLVGGASGFQSMFVTELGISFLAYIREDQL